MRSNQFKYPGVTLANNTLSRPAGPGVLAQLEGEFAPSWEFRRRIAAALSASLAPWPSLLLLRSDRQMAQLCFF